VLPACLASLERQTFRDFRLLLVDNGSRDGSLSIVQGCALEHSVIDFESNTGFARAVNTGIQQACSSYILLLNNDVVLDDRCLEQLVEYLERELHAAAVSPRIMQWKDPDRIDSLGIGMSREGKGFQLGWGKRWTGGISEPFRVFGACAACALYRREAFEDVGLLDSCFFAYLEDVDWSFRANWQGLQTYAVPYAVAYHRGSHTTGGHYSPFSLYWILRNQWAVLLKNLPASLWLRCAPWILYGQAKTAARAVLLEKQPRLYFGAMVSFLRYLPVFAQGRTSARRCNIAPSQMVGLMLMSEAQMKGIESNGERIPKFHSTVHRHRQLEHP
jgi:hypothetical protein